MEKRIIEVKRKNTNMEKLRKNDVVRFDRKNDMVFKVIQNPFGNNMIKVEGIKL